MTAWFPRAQPHSGGVSPVIPDDVLFFFDEPLIFTSLFLSCPAICYKYSENQDGDLSYYIAAPTSQRIMSALKQGRLSIRGALAIPSVWIYEADGEGNVEGWWNCSFDEIPEGALPVRNLGLRREYGSVPDQISIRLRDAPFMSVNFLGGALNAASINLLDFKQLVNNTYDCLKDIVRKALIENGNPNVTLGQLERMLNIPLRQPNLASLRLDIGRPILEERQDSRIKDLNYEVIYSGIDKHKAAFIDVAETIGREAESRRFSLQFARDNIDAIENILGIIPNDETVFRTVEIVAEDIPNGRIRIDAQEGQKILDAYKSVHRDPRWVGGQVVEVNFRSNSFIIKSNHGREITCVIPSGWAGSRPSKAGEEVNLYGKLQTRKRRDLFFIDRDFLL